jgi:SAM-dependent methyltransferase
MNVTAEVRSKFLREYAHIRHAEGRGSENKDYYRALPFHDLSGRNSAMWAMRATTYRYFINKVLKPLERGSRKELNILDLGAGNCWLSNQLSLRGHKPIAIDIFSDKQDGLGAARFYSTHFSVLENDFDQLPLASAQFDLAIFNASFHYSLNYSDTLREARRCLRPAGLVVILDSPVYRSAEDGERMVAEKRAEFTSRYGFPSDTLPSREYLDVPTLAKLEREFGLVWCRHKPWYGLRWHSRPLKAWLRNRRTPSQFWMLVGKFLQP